MTDGGGSGRGNNTWTEERVRLLTELWGQGYSASQTAAQIGGGVTRNAVIGKVHRLGLAKRAEKTHVSRQAASSGHFSGGGGSASVPLTVGANALKPVAPRRAPAMPAPAPAHQIEAPESKGLTLMMLSSKTCRWPHGHPGEAEFGFCGHRTQEDSPYCRFHSQRAFQSVQDRRRLRRAG